MGTELSNDPGAMIEKSTHSVGVVVLPFEIASPLALHHRTIDPFT